MQLVLVAGMNPRVNGVGPKVKLAEGWYKLIVEHQIDSVLVLHDSNYGRQLEGSHGYEFHSWGEVWHLELRGGSEEYINVFAEKINGPVAATTS